MGRHGLRTCQVAGLSPAPRSSPAPQGRRRGARRSHLPGGPPRAGRRDAFVSESVHGGIGAAGEGRITHEFGGPARPRSTRAVWWLVRGRRRRGRTDTMQACLDHHAAAAKAPPVMADRPGVLCRSAEARAAPHDRRPGRAPRADRVADRGGPARPAAPNRSPRPVSLRSTAREADLEELDGDRTGAGEECVADHDLLSRSGSYGRHPCEVNLPSGSRAVSRWQWDDVSGSD